ncbi:DNA polymerase III subunit alpha [Paenalkalicoccus suaedae]|uniref:DNA polymerase III subunit alpha n=1 Tax=Paenalkalicoccus suaedae TaxID=2592382 RepID=A0A859FHA8_9BACI|nr:DNA polymerase III subunit alpha [Paenalkalicoccus suaedae]QKS72042.1 DNA polymerase III subunit alpha [Paenalkalicoccus suaedae]
MSFVHLHVHSEYSLLQSAARIDGLVRRAKELHYDTLALTDIDAMYGAIPFFEACQKYEIKPIIGVEISVESASTRLLLLAKNQSGYEGLVKLVTICNTKEERERFITYEELAEFASNFVIISPFIEGPIQAAVMSGQDALAIYKQLKAMTENVYVELQPIRTREARQKLLDVSAFAKANTIRTVASNHVQFLYPEDMEATKTLHAIKLGCSIEELPTVTAEENYLTSPEEMVEHFSSLPEAIRATREIADMCSFEPPMNELHLPSFDVADSKRELAEWCDRGLHKRYGKAITEDIQKRLQHELSVIGNMGFEDYFLIVADFMQFAHREGIPTGPGRGSAAGSLVAYVLEITNVDPIKYGLLFERFLNPERVSMPDIDIDFSDIDRDLVIQYVANKYGKERVAQIVTFGTLAAKAALRDSARTLQIDPRKIDQLAKLVPSKPQTKLKDAMEVKRFKELVDGDEELARLYRIAETIEGLPRHTSVHAAGIVMSKERLDSLVPLQSGNDGLYITQYPMGVLEKIGLLKMDFLGLRNLSFMQRVLYLSREQGNAIDIENLPSSDEATFKVLGDGDTSGIFQLESQGMRSVLRRLKPTSFEDIVAVNALYRPGPMEQIPVYINRKHGKEAVQYPHTDLTDILKPTYGVMIYQEQIMQIAAKMAGYRLGEADLLRRAVSKKKREDLEQGREQFVNGARRLDYSEQDALTVYDLIVRFADYGFNRSHAVAYSMISYQLAYLKAHVPHAFMSGLMDTSLHHHEKLADYVNETKKMGIAVLAPSVTESHVRCTLEGDAIRLGLGMIKHIGYRAMQQIVDARREKRFADFFDFVDRLQHVLNRRALEVLIVSGSLDDIHPNRNELLASLDEALVFAEKEQEKRQQGDDFLFFEEDVRPTYKEAKELPLLERLRLERETVGFYLSGHPLEEAMELLSTYKRMTIAEAKEQKPHVSVRVAGLVESVRAIETKKKEQMAFVLLSDESGELDITVFPKQYKEHQLKLTPGDQLFIEGKLQEYSGELSLILDKCTTVETLMERAEAEREPTLYLFIPTVKEKTGLDELKKLLEDTPGDTKVVMKYESTNQVIRLSEMWNVGVDASFITKLKGLLGVKNVVLKNQRV